jgi:DNA-binding response OmpR family regulator
MLISNCVCYKYIKMFLWHAICDKGLMMQYSIKVPQVLLVDDDKFYLHFISQFIQNHGFNVISLTSKQELSHQLSLHIPNVIILDVILNGENGRDICKEIKTQYKDIPIILISADPELLKDHQRWKADDVMEKPFEMKSLIDKIITLLDSYEIIQ